jgi:hypothetical protein
VLFDRLTVEEHLWLFAMLKGCPSRRVSSEIDKMIQSVGLSDKRCVQTRALSGGMKRKLSVGIALIAGSKVIKRKRTLNIKTMIPGILLTSILPVTITSGVFGGKESSKRFLLFAPKCKLGSNFARGLARSLYDTNNS